MTASDRALQPAADSAARILALSTRKAGTLEELVAWIREAAPWIENADVAMVRQVAEQLIVLRQMHGYIDRVGLLDSRGRPRRSYAWIERLQRSLLRDLHLLGLTPASRHELEVLARDGTSPAERKRRQHRLATAARVRTEAARSTSAGARGSER